jgi:hypothetical protein
MKTNKFQYLLLALALTLGLMFLASIPQAGWESLSYEPVSGGWESLLHNVINGGWESLSYEPVS